MTSPPSNLPSPTPSSSSAHQHQSFSAMPPPSHPSRAPSTASMMSSSSLREKQYQGGGYSNGGPAEMMDAQTPHAQSSIYHDSQGGSSHPIHSSQTPQPQHPLPPHQAYANLHSQTFLPHISSSPPPHPPQYIPPPQHAMAPDPIHNIPLGMVPPSAGGMMPPPWSNGPVPGSGPGGAGPSWRAAQSLPGQGGYKLPNGYPPNPLESYPHRMVGTPGPLQGNSLLQQAIMGNGHRPSSVPGEARERRRRDRDDEEEEVITTIFVVGFPDDMQEREFQNIFTFSPGFEAATLKFPSGSNRLREPTAALLAELQQLAANQAAAGGSEHGDIPIAPLEDALAALQMGGAMTGSTSSSTTPSAAISLTPSAPNGPMLSNAPNLPTRRQTIGFARFKTRADALAAKEHLQGRKIDTLTGASLKAEMAKKNLHTKRTTSGEELVGLLLRSGRLAGLMGMNQAGASGSGVSTSHLPSGIGNPNSIPIGRESLNNSLPHPSAKEAWDSWPNTSSANPLSPNMSNADRDILPNSINNAMSTRDRGSFSGYEEKPSGYGSNNGYTFPSYPNPSSLQPNITGGLSNSGGPLGAGGTSAASTSDSPPLSIKSPNARPTDSKALLALAEEADELEGWSVGGIMDYRGAGHSSAAGGGNDRTGAMYSQIRQFGIPTASNGAGAGAPYGMSGNGVAGYGTSPPGAGGGSDALSETGRSLGALSNSATNNPADQNPPINTLYVGNLPAISPPTHPPNFLEESLRSLFQTCPGFKRMSFRQKINGPMCFVEFEDVGYAANAIMELYGHTLGGLVKGGIRLSYSKNSLGQRGNAHNNGIGTPMFGGIAHTVALAGMSSPQSQASKQFANSNSGGMPPSSAPLNMSSSGSGGIGDHRLPSESAASGITTLSPTAQPFNASLPITTSPRSRYFATTSAANPPSININTNSNTAKDSSPTYGGYPAAVPASGGSSSSNSFSPVSSPIRTPASFSWVSSGHAHAYGMGMGMGMGMGGLSMGMGMGGGALGIGGMSPNATGPGSPIADGTSNGIGGSMAYSQGTSASSLNGVANAWSQSQHN